MFRKLYRLKEEKAIIKLVTSSEKVIRYALKNKYLSRLIVFNLKYLSSIEREELYNAIATYVYTSDKTSKQTAGGRFRDINEHVLKYLKPDGENEIHDVAVSTGQTSYELYELLKQYDINFHLSISDKFSRYFVTGNNIVRIHDINGRFVCGYVCNILADNNYYINKAFVITRLLGNILSKTKSIDSFDRDILLYNKHIVNMLSNNFIEEVDYDIFETDILNKYTFVRCMNIFNLDYFAEDRLFLAVDKVAKSLKENGVLQIGRTVKAKNDVSFFIKQKNVLKHLEDINNGTEIKHIIEKYNKCKTNGIVNPVTEGAW